MTTADTSHADGVWTVLVAAGSGQRFGADKLHADLDDERTVLEVALRQAQEASEGVVLVVRSDDRRLTAPPPGVTAVAGGASRSASVRRGLQAVPDTAQVVLVHDAARPLADGPLYRRVIAAVRAGASAVVPAIPVVDTIRSLDGSPVARDQLRAVQTPQGFDPGTLRAAHAGGGDATDDASLVEADGGEVVLVDGDVRNLKITRPVDIELARALLHHR